MAALFPGCTFKRKSRPFRCIHVLHVNVGAIRGMKLSLNWIFFDFKITWREDLKTMKLDSIYIYIEEIFTGQAEIRRDKCITTHLE